MPIIASISVWMTTKKEASRIVSMTTRNLKSVRAVMGLSGQGFAHLLRLHDTSGRTVYRWENGETPIPGYVTLVCELLELPAVRAYLATQKTRAVGRKRRSRASRPAA